MKIPSFRERLENRLAASNLVVTPSQLEQLDRYFQILLRWDRTINLTGFELDPIGDQAIDRLFCEPLAAVPHFPGTARSWIDIGSGAGSPAFPIKIAMPSLTLSLVETRARKCAFLREASRELDLGRVCIVNQRFEEAAETMDRAGIITIRAVRPDPRLSRAVGRVLEDAGLVLVFGEVDLRDWPDFTHPELIQLLPSARSFLSVLKKI